ncbi:uncharacterized protein LOC120068170 [Benincasa hispida]|uniref:uncharacterized protein LOC120068170 n=1 Tax=Benincasa hispida TaxID=102211 RepID=UPI0018FFA311|nr:uncharacterized protein LOC120068170 [Benincasa hispida]
MADKEQVKPLASATVEPRSDDDIFLPPPAKLHLHKNKYIKFCGCFAALLIILAVIGIVLGFTVLHIRTPNIKIDSLSFLNSTSSSNSRIIFVVASVSVRNPNVASFKYSKASTEIYYHGTVIGEGETPPGEVKAKDTLKMNMTVEIEPEKIDDASSLIKDWNLGALNISSYTEIPGRVKILGSIKKHFLVKITCSLTFNSRSEMIQGQDCDQRVRISV